MIHNGIILDLVVVVFGLSLLPFGRKEPGYILLWGVVRSGDSG